jgi:predicted O-methyltransferase YrrM
MIREFELSRQSMNFFGDPRVNNPHNWEKGYCDYVGAVYEMTTLCPDNSIFVDIGVDLGVSLSALSNAKNAKLVYAVDPYLEYEQSYIFHWTRQQAYEFVVNEFLPSHKNVQLIRDTSLAVSKFIEDKSVDLVVIDANHTYESGIEDLSAWLPKVKSGGLIAGHDYSQKVYPGLFNAINQVVGIPDNVFESAHWYKKVK